MPKRVYTKKKFLYDFIHFCFYMVFMFCFELIVAFLVRKFSFERQSFIRNNFFSFYKKFFYYIPPSSTVEGKEVTMREEKYTHKKNQLAKSVLSFIIIKFKFKFLPQSDYCAIVQYFMQYYVIKMIIIISFGRTINLTINFQKICCYKAGTLKQFNYTLNSTAINYLTHGAL